jgi:hypothetical protein
MDEETKSYLAAMEARLMARMNDSFERVTNRVDAVERDLRDLRTEHSATRELVSQLPGTLLTAMERPLLNRLANIEARVTGLERKQPKE